MYITDSTGQFQINTETEKISIKEDIGDGYEMYETEICVKELKTIISICDKKRKNNG